LLVSSLLLNLMSKKFEMNCKVETVSSPSRNAVEERPKTVLSALSFVQENQLSTEAKRAYNATTKALKEEMSEEIPPVPTRYDIQKYKRESRTGSSSSLRNRSASGLK
jgi:hypothetical protein